ncbi:MAG: hypothetical protein M1840_002557 [Geoglossum simile]|nr:MAG: hypothetical protein M1840_002557 [Geoglossum simile]
MSGYIERERYQGNVGGSKPVRVRDRGNYKPVAIRAPALTGIFALTLILIALLEFACRSLPEAVSSKHPEQSERESDNEISDLAVAPRAFTTSPLSPPTTSYLLGQSTEDMLEQSTEDLSETDTGDMMGQGTGNDPLSTYAVTQDIMEDLGAYLTLALTVTTQITAPKIVESQPAGKTPTGAQRGSTPRIGTPAPAKQPLETPKQRTGDVRSVHEVMTAITAYLALTLIESQPAGETRTGAEGGSTTRIGTPTPFKRPLIHSTTSTQKEIEGFSEVAAQLVVSLDPATRSPSPTGSRSLGGKTKQLSQTIDSVSHPGQPTGNRNPHKTTLQPGVATTDPIPRPPKPTGNRNPKGTAPRQISVPTRTAAAKILGPGPDSNNDDNGDKGNDNGSNNDRDNSNDKNNDKDNDDNNSNNDNNGNNGNNNKGNNGNNGSNEDNNGNNGSNEDNNGNNGNNGNNDNNNNNDNSSNHNATTTTTTTVIRWPVYKYLIGTYLPTLISIAYRAAWTTIYASTKLLEPFCQLSEPTGALAQDALGVCYLSSSLTPSPMIGLASRRHPVMLLTSIAYVISGALIPPLASETLFVDTQGCGRGRRCLPRLAVARASGRVVQGLLGFLAAVVLGLIVLQRTRRSGVRADPARIATVAGLLHHPEVVADFRRGGGEAGPVELDRQLWGRRYRIAHYSPSSPEGGLRYGLVPIHNTTPPTPPPPPTDNERPKGRLESPVLRLALREAAFCLLLGGILGLIAAYWRERRDTGFNRFMNSQTFGPRFLMTSLGILIDSQWKRIEREVRAVNPYRILARGRARACDTIAVNFTSTPLTTFTASLRRRHFFVAFVAFVALLSEILVVALSGIPFNSSQTYAAFQASAYTSVSILALMVVAVFALVYWRRRPLLPRMPNTLAAVLSYVCASRMLEDPRELQAVGEGDRRGGLTFSYGRLRGVDAVTRWAVDRDSNNEVA